MNVRWMAVLTGFIVDYTISLVLVLFASPDFFTSTDLTRLDHLVLLCLLTLATGVGGYVAGRMARADRALNGLLVAVVGILVGQLSGGPLPRLFVIASAISCLLAALGGFLGRYPPVRRPHSSG